jgi:hypothetical protein
MRPGCEPVRGWPLSGRGNQSSCQRQNPWTQSGTDVFLGLKVSQGPQLGGVAQVFIHMGDWCGSVRRIRHRKRRNDGCANGTTPGRRRRPKGFSARHFPRESWAVQQSQRRGATGKISQSTVREGEKPCGCGSQARAVRKTLFVKKVLSTSPQKCFLLDKAF